MALVKWDELHLRIDGLVKEPKLDWMKVLQSRYQHILKSLEDFETRFDKYTKSLSSKQKTQQASYEGVLDDQMILVADALGFVNLVLDGKNVHMEDLWALNARLMPESFQKMPLVEERDKFAYKLAEAVKNLKKAKEDAAESAP